MVSFKHIIQIGAAITWGGELIVPLREQNPQFQPGDTDRLTCYMTIIPKRIAPNHQLY